MLLGDSALAYAGNIAYLRLGPYLAAVDTDAPYNRRLLEMHDAVHEPAHTPPPPPRSNFGRARPTKTLGQALVDSGYPGPLPVVLSHVFWAVFEVAPGIYVEDDSNLVLGT